MDKTMTVIANIPTEACASETSWNNHTNRITFYEKPPIQTLLEGYAVRGGLADGSDINLIYHHIQNAHSLLEVGAGYGRVLRNLLDRGFSGKITAIEQSAQLFKTLKENYESKVDCYHEDILNFNPLKKFDVILWLWSGISDFSKEEQPLVMKKLYELLDVNGVLILDTFRCLEVPANSIQSTDQSYTVNECECVVHGYIPSPRELESYTTLSGFKNINFLEYTTTTNRKRSMYILKK